MNSEAWTEIVIPPSVDHECNSPVESIVVECYDEHSLFVTRHEENLDGDNQDNCVQITVAQAKQLREILGRLLDGTLHKS